MAPSSPLDQAFHRFLDSGDRSDLAPVFDQSSPTLLRQAAAAGLGAEAAEDVVQETFIVVMERRDRFVRGAPFLPWASGILVRQIRAEKRRRARALEFLGGTSHDASNDPETSDVAASEVRQVIEKSLRTVSESNRDVVRLALFEGLSAGEIGDRMSLSAGATSVRLHRGLKELREKIKSRAGSLGATALALPAGVPGGSALPEAAATKAVAKKSAAFGSGMGLPYALLGGALVAAAALITWWPAKGSNAGAAPGSNDIAHSADVDSGAGGTTEAESPGSVRVATGSDEHATEGAAALQGLAFTGRVLSPNGRVGVAGAMIFAIDTEPNIILPTEPLRPVAVTDENGEYALSSADLPPGETACILLARKSAGGSPMQTGWTSAPRGQVAEEGARSLPLEDITLETGFFMDLSLVDELGHPLEGAQVSALSTHSRFFRYPSKEQLDSGFIPVGPYRFLFGAESNDQGRARIEGLFGAGESHTLGIFSASKEGYATASVALQIGGASSLEETLVLRSLASLKCSGIVTGSEGIPLGGAELSFRVRGEAAVSGTTILRTQADGSWALPGSLLDEYPMEIVVSGAGYAPTSISFQDASELPGDTIQTRLVEAHPFRGILVDEEGEPLQGAEVHAGVGSTTRSAVTDDAGRFEWTDLQDGPIALAVLGEDLAGRRLGARFIAIGRHAEQRFELPPVDAVSHFSCVTEPGDPLERASLVSQAVPGFEGEWPLTPGEEGSFGSPGVPTGQWVLAAMTRAGRTVIQEVVIAPDATAEQLRIPAPEGGSFQVAIASSPSSPPDELGQVATLRAERLPFVEFPSWIRTGERSPGESVQREIPTDGPISIVDLSPGTWAIVISGAGWSSDPAIVEIRPGGLARVDVTAERATRVNIPLPRLGRPGWCTVQFRRDETSPWIVHDVASVSPDGFEQAEASLAPGSWQWQISLHTFYDGEAVVDQRPAETGTVDVPVTGEIVLAPWGDD